LGAFLFEMYFGEFVAHRSTFMARSFLLSACAWHLATIRAIMFRPLSQRTTNILSS